jgi:membrane protease YdiL (CAAX protease family)
MPGAAWVLMAAIPLAVAGAWGLVRLRVLSVWHAMGPVLGVLAVVALLTERVRWTSGSAGTAALAGAAAGVGLYLATAAFMAVAGGWPPLARQADDIYGERREVSLGSALTVAALVVGPGEEIVWRGLALNLVEDATGSLLVAAGVTLVVYIGANAVSGSLPIVLGAVVGGATWTVLAVVTGGVLAGMVSHALWTALMILRPPISPRPG